ncbi:hypothetical protein [Paracoccus tegillarcae]|nr:hypothetical protein [Paracoccus tegillarcae]
MPAWQEAARRVSGGQQTVLKRWATVSITSPGGRRHQLRVRHEAAQAAT